MIERLLLVSTCGTSLLTNGASDDDRRWLTQIANDVDVDSARLTSIVDERCARLKAADEPTRRKRSAELNGVGAVIDRCQPKQVFHLLVHTDTALSKVTTDMVQLSDPASANAEVRALSKILPAGRDGAVGAGPPLNDVGFACRH